MTEVAASHLSDILDGGLPAADLTEAVTDAAVVFLLAMRRSGILRPKADSCVHRDVERA